MKTPRIIKALRAGKGMTQMDVVFAVKQRGVVGLSEPHYRRIEQGKVVPSVRLAMEIASVLESDVYEIWE